MTIGNKEFDFKISRISDAKKMEDAIKKMEKTEQKIGKKQNLSEILQETIRMFQDFFVDTVGENVLAGCEDVAEAKAAYLAFLSDVMRQKEDVLGVIRLEDIR